MVIRKRLDISEPSLVFVTTATYHHTPVFTDDRAANILLDQFNEVSQAFGISIVGYVVMPTHFHALIGLPNYSQLSKFMGTVKSLSARRIKQLSPPPAVIHGSAGSKSPIWANRFDDIIITSEEQFRIKLNYIHNNPVKGNLVKNPAMWKYSSAADWLGNHAGLLTIDKDFGWTGR
jgi:putative transposase